MLNYYLCCQESYEEGDNIWFSAYTHNGLYQVNRRTNEINRMATFPGEKGNAMMLYKAVVHKKDWLIFVPCMAEEIAVYNYKNEQMKKIPLREVTGNYRVNYSGEYKFWTGISYKNYVYLLGLRYPAIIRLNPCTGETVYDTNWLEAVELKINGDRPGYWADWIIRGKYAYLPCLCLSAVLRYDLETNEKIIIDIPSKIEGFYGIGDDGTNLWMVPMECENIVKWNPESGAVKEIKVPYRRKEIFPFHKPMFTQKGAYLFPFRTEDVFRIDLKTETVKWNKKFSNILDIEKKDYSAGIINVLNLQKTKYGFSYINNKDYSWHTYDTRTGAESITYWEVTGKEREYIQQLFMKDRISREGLLLEEEEWPFLLYMNSVFINRPEKGKYGQREVVGKNIYNIISDWMERRERDNNV